MRMIEQPIVNTMEVQTLTSVEVASQFPIEVCELITSFLPTPQERRLQEVVEFAATASRCSVLYELNIDLPSEKFEEHGQQILYLHTSDLNSNTSIITDINISIGTLQSNQTWTRTPGKPASAVESSYLWLGDGDFDDDRSITDPHHRRVPTTHEDANHSEKCDAVAEKRGRIAIQSL